jgi:hypothetical protein
MTITLSSKHTHRYVRLLDYERWYAFQQTIYGSYSNEEKKGERERETNNHDFKKASNYYKSRLFVDEEAND